MNKEPTHDAGVGLLGILTILFIGLKLTGYITWPWLWVLAPTWIPLSFVLILVLLVALGKTLTKAE